MKTPILIICAVALTMTIPVKFDVEDSAGNPCGTVTLGDPVQGSGYWRHYDKGDDLICGGIYTVMDEDHIVFTWKDGETEYMWQAARIGETDRWLVLGQHPFVSPATGSFNLVESY